MPKRRYSEAEVLWLAAEYRQHRASVVAERYAKIWGRTVSAASVKCLLHARGYSSGRPPGMRAGEHWVTWSPEMVAWLRAHRSEAPIGLITARFNARFGLIYNARQIAATCKRNGIRARGDGRFAQGQTPWNAGLSGYSPGGRSAETRFRRGHIPWRTMPVGAYRTAPDGIWLVKVSDGAPPNYSRRDWREVHRLTWEGVHGPIPAGHVVVFLDGDPGHCLNIANLDCIPRGVLVRLNGSGWAELLPDLALRRAAIATARLSVASSKACARIDGLSWRQRCALINGE